MHYIALYCIVLYCVEAVLYIRVLLSVHECVLVVILSVYEYMVLSHAVYVVTKLQMLTNAPQDSTTVMQTLTHDAVTLKVRSNASARQGTPEMA